MAVYYTVINNLESRNLGGGSVNICNQGLKKKSAFDLIGKGACNMKKRAIGLFLGLVMVLFGAISLTALDYNAPQSRAVLYDNNRLGGNASADSTEFTASKNNGDTICVWYENKANSSVKVTLYKYGWFGLKSNVLDFEVAGNSSKSEEYTASGANTGTYYINIQASDGGVITGYLRANQIN